MQRLGRYAGLRDSEKTIYGWTLAKDSRKNNIQIMSLLVFEDYDLITLSDALDIAEDVTSNFYKYSTGQWKKYPYEVKTLKSLSKEEISESVFALLNKGSMIAEGFEQKKTIEIFTLFAFRTTRY